MKFWEVIIIVVLSVALTLGSLWAWDQHKESLNPQLKAQRISQEILDAVASINTGGLDVLYAYQKAHKLPGEKQVCLIVPTRLLNAPAKPQK